MHGSLLKVNPRHCVALQLGSARGQLRCERRWRLSSETRPIDRRPPYARAETAPCVRGLRLNPTREGKTRCPSRPPPLPALLTYNRSDGQFQFPRRIEPLCKSLRSQALSTLRNKDTRKSWNYKLMCPEIRNLENRVDQFVFPKESREQNDVLIALI